jgi:YHS domain-containing protein
MKKSTTIALATLVLFGLTLSSGIVSAADTSKAKCPVSGKAVDADASAAHNGGTVYFCCGKCQAAFEKNSAKFVTKANQQLVVTGQAAQQKCPISGGKTKDATALAVGGVDITFCCNKCRERVNTATGDDQLDLVFGAKAFGKGFAIAELTE